MTFLLDTGVLAETSKVRRDEGVAEWISGAPEHRLYLSTIGDRIVPVTVDVAKEWGGRSGCQADALIAATAKVHGWTLVTRNVKDFEHTGVRVLNPFVE